MEIFLARPKCRNSRPRHAFCVVGFSIARDTILERPARPRVSGKALQIQACQWPGFATEAHKKNPRHPNRVVATHRCASPRPRQTRSAVMLSNVRGFPFPFHAASEAWAGGIPGAASGPGQSQEPRTLESMTALQILRATAAPASWPPSRG